MLEPRPPQWVIDIMDQAAYLRGRYLSCFAQCEFLLADLSVRVDNRFRYTLKKKINAAKVMAGSGGPLNAYADEFIPLLNSLVERSDVRHWLAHGFMELTVDRAGNHLLSYRRYLDDAERLTIWQCTLSHMQDEVDSITVYTNNFLRLCRRIYQELGLEEI